MYDVSRIKKKLNLAGHRSREAFFLKQLIQGMDCSEEKFYLTKRDVFVRREHRICTKLLKGILSFKSIS